MTPVASACWTTGPRKLPYRWLGAAMMLSLCLVMLACGGGQANTAQGAYGGALNHTHDVLALRGMPDTALLATHIGLYRTSDQGRTWSEVAGGNGQVMDGLMIFKLAQSPVDPDRVYVLAIPRTGTHGATPGVPGLYTSADAGKTWKQATPDTVWPTHTVFTIGAGSSSAGQIFTIIPALAQNGLYVSDDFGAHWRALPPLPDAHPTGVTGVPGHPGRLLMWSSSTGVYQSDDAGLTWRPAAGTHSGVFALSVAGNTIYASGDAGTFVSTDAGVSFTLTNSTYTFSAVVGCAAAPEYAYAITGTTVYATSDRGKTWTATGNTTSHPGNLAVDADDPRVAYVAFSYPVGVDLTTDAGARWGSVLP